MYVALRNGLMLPQLSIVLCRSNFKVIFATALPFRCAKRLIWDTKNRKVRFVGAVAYVSKSSIIA